MTKFDIKENVKKGIPLVCGICASAVAKTILEEYLPESDKLIEKVAAKIGVCSIGLVVTAAVNHQIEEEVDDLAEIVEAFAEMVKERISQDDIRKTADVIYADDAEGVC